MYYQPNKCPAPVAYCFLHSLCSTFGFSLHGEAYAEGYENSNGILLEETKERNESSI